MAPIPALLERAGCNIASLSHIKRSLSNFLDAAATSAASSSKPRTATLQPSTSRFSTLLSRFPSSSLYRRDTVAIPTVYQGLKNSPAPGTVVGIVFGSVAGFLFILWLIYLAFGLAGRGNSGGVVEEEIVRTRSTRSPSRSPRRTHHRRERSQMVEVRRSRSPPARRPSTRERIIVEERRSTPMAPPPPEEDDIVEVIEEHTPPTSRVSRNQRESGWRAVDPDAYGGRESAFEEGSALKIGYMMG